VSDDAASQSPDAAALRAWLDDHEADECGDSVACFSFSYTGDLLESLKGEIRDAVNLDRRSRVYIVYMLDGKVKGRFIVGRRKAAPWEGYGQSEEHEEDEADGQGS